MSNDTFSRFAVVNDRDREMAHSAEWCSKTEAKASISHAVAFRQITLQITQWSHSGSNHCEGYHASNMRNFLVDLIVLLYHIINFTRYLVQLATMTPVMSVFGWSFHTSFHFQMISNIRTSLATLSASVSVVHISVKMHWLFVTHEDECCGLTMKILERCCTLCRW